MQPCPRCDLKRHRACTCGKVAAWRLQRGASLPRHVGKQLLMTEPIRIGTECSGIEAPIVALRRMGVSHDHVFSTECNESARIWSNYNNSPWVRHCDITQRDPESLGQVDLYVCGIPCQDFSNMNHHRGEKVKCVGIVVSLIDGIKTSRPKGFVLENVPSFRKHELCKKIETSLSMEYEIYKGVLSPHDYGCPQNRKRFYMVGIRKCSVVAPFEWPEPIPLEKSCLDMLFDGLTGVSFETCLVKDKYYQRKLKEWDLNGVRRIVSLSTYALHKEGPKSTNISPCVLASHPGLYAPHLGRLLHPKELLKLQGFSGVIIPPSLSNSVVRRLTGNAMSVDVLMHLFISVFKCIGKDAVSAFSST